MLMENGAPLPEGAPSRVHRLSIDGHLYVHKSWVDRAAKRAFDLLAGGVGMLIALPLFAVIAYSFMPAEDHAGL